MMSEDGEPSTERTQRTIEVTFLKSLQSSSQERYIQLKKEIWNVTRKVKKLKRLKKERKKLIMDLTDDVAEIRNEIDENQKTIDELTQQASKEYRKHKCTSILQYNALDKSVYDCLMFNELGKVCEHHKNVLDEHYEDCECI